MCPAYFPAQSFIAKALVCVARNAPHLRHVAALPSIVGSFTSSLKGVRSPESSLVCSSTEPAKTAPHVPPKPGANRPQPGGVPNNSVVRN